jgi:hypothetical protein
MARVEKKICDFTAPSRDVTNQALSGQDSVAAQINFLLWLDTKCCVIHEELHNHFLPSQYYLLLYSGFSDSGHISHL